MPSITPRKNKNGEIISYSIRVYKGYDINGNRLKPYTMTWKPTEGMTKRQIEKELHKQAAEFERQCESGNVANSSMRLADFIPQYLDIISTTLSPTTVDTYKALINKLIIPAMGHLKLKDITPAHVQAFIQQLSTMPKENRAGEIDEEGQRLAASTVHRRLNILQSILRQAVKLRLIPESPASTEKLSLPKIKQPKVEIFSKQEAAEMLTCLEKEPLQFQVLIQLAIFTGARRGELVALKFSDVDFQQSKITIERAAVKVKGEETIIKPPKDYEVRTVTVNKSCIELIQALQFEKAQERQKLGSQWQGDDWIFTQWNGEIMNPQTPTKQFSKFLNKYHLKHRKFHSLRHTSATLLLYGGVSIKQVQGRLGHGDIETTNKYLHIIEEADIEAANILGEMLTSRNSEEQIGELKKEKIS